MKYTFKCDSCPDGVQEVDYTAEQVKSMTDAGLDLATMKGRCPGCEAKLLARLYPKPQPRPEPKPMSEGAIRAQLPLVTLTKIGPAQKACSKCKELYDGRWLDEDGECPKCQGAEQMKQGELL